MAGLSLAELLVIAVGLSMDAFAVSICKGLATPRVRLRQVLCAGAYFGGFQAAMPVIGFALGTAFAAQITRVDHWIAFVLLGLIGGNMIREALGHEMAAGNASFSATVMLPLAVATSIDALASGVTFAALRVQIVQAALCIGATTFLLSAAGVWVGHVFGARYKDRAELAGGVMLVGMGVRILLTHLGLIA